MQTVSASRHDRALSLRVWLVLSVVALCVGGAMFLWRETPQVGRTSIVKTVVPNPASSRTKVAGGDSPITNIDPQRAQTKVMLLGKWKHSYLTTRIRVDLPAALARRNAGAPDLKAMGVFMQKHGLNSWQMNGQQAKEMVTAMANLTRANPKWADEFPGLEWLAWTVKRLQVTSETMPLTSDWTAGTLANEVATLPGMSENMLRGWMVEVERQTYKDEQLARQVVELKSNAEINAYLQANAERYTATYQQMLANLPLKESLRAYYDESAHEIAVSYLVYSYVDYWNSEVNAVENDFNAWWLSVERQLNMREDSRDDAEIREMITEMRDLQREMNKMIAAANSALPSTVAPSSGIPLNPP